jgi:hypothetical protein
MDSQTQALFDSPTIDKSGIGEYSFDSLKSKKSEKDDKKSQKSQDEQEVVKVVEKPLQKVSSLNAIRRQRFVIQPTNEPAATPSFGSPKRQLGDPLEVSPASPIILTANRPNFHTSMRSVISGIHLNALQVEPQQRTVGPHHITPQLLHLARSGSTIFSDGGSTRLFTDATSVRSLASFGLGVTDGKRIIIRKVPNSPQELIQLITPTL